MYLKLCNDYELIIAITMTSSDNRIIFKLAEKLKAHKESF